MSDYLPVTHDRIGWFCPNCWHHYSPDVTLCDCAQPDDWDDGEADSPGDGDYCCGYCDGCTCRDETDESEESEESEEHATVTCASCGHTYPILDNHVCSGPIRYNVTYVPIGSTGTTTALNDTYSVHAPSHESGCAVCGTHRVVAV